MVPDLTADNDSPPSGLRAAGETPVFEHVRGLAETLAQGSYQSDEIEIPEPLRTMDISSYRQILFRPDRALWPDLRYRVVLRPMGSYHQRQIKIHVVDGEEISTVACDADMFEFGSSGIDPALATDLGFSGWALHYAHGEPTDLPEIAVFQGATSFKAIGIGQEYGAFARGLAVNTGCQRAKSSPFFASSGWRDRYQAPPNSASTRCWTARASPVPTPSNFNPIL